MVALIDNRDVIATKARRREGQMDERQRFASIDEMVRNLRPCMPVRCFHADAIDAAAREFIDGFPGDILYAVKANPDPAVIARLYAAGVAKFDVASLAEIALVQDRAPGAFMAYMHPIKSRESIRIAYQDYGIRVFAIDCFEEMHKILEETQAATDLTLMIRLAMPDDMAHHALSKKFGAQADEAVLLLQDAAKVAHKVGLCFHVGHLCTDHAQYRRAIDYAAKIIAEAGVELDVFDVGGGFARAFPGMEASPLGDYFATIRSGLQTLNLSKACQIWCEPGLALVADSESLVVRVELRKGNALYINDGTYGSLFDAAKFADKKRFPVQLIRTSRKPSAVLQPFEFYGPTCDSIDHMPGPFMLPKDAREGDWIVIGRQGAYGSAFRTNFNGFHDYLPVEIDPTQTPRRVVRRKLALATTSQEIKEQ